MSERGKQFPLIHRPCDHGLKDSKVACRSSGMTDRHSTKLIQENGKFIFTGCGRQCGGKQNSHVSIFRYVAVFIGRRDAIRTHDLWLRRPTLYPAELPALFVVMVTGLPFYYRIQPGFCVQCSTKNLFEIPR